ncbi:glycosyltransferase family 4 protein [Methylocapsa acidiphila]|uniref:glycosyltransferase family 4 protein n=1 Tax=Methylocapsa acidiphila TaxID=133552 RepID=UPI0004121DCA|nr:glycosyltransferase [Methylocapsa acidiphila]
MRVLQVTPAFFPGIGGIETVVQELVIHLRRNGVESDVAHLSPGHASSRRDQMGDFTVFRVPLRPNRFIGVASGLGQLFQDYDLIHVHDPQLMAVSANVILFGRGKKKVLSTHGGYMHTSNHALFKRIHWGLVARPLLRQYDAILASGEQDFELYRSKAPHARLIQNGVNVEKFDSIVRTSAPCAARWIYWGRLSRNKRLDNLIASVGACRRSGLDVDLLVAGRDFDGLEPALRAQIAELGLAEHVHIAGPLSDKELANELERRSVFVTASEYEGFGLSLIEAMAAGLVVLCRDIPPMNGFVDDGKNGVFLSFDGGDEDLAALKALCAKPEAELAAMQNNARARAQAYGWKNAVQKFIAAYENVLANRI